MPGRTPLSDDAVSNALKSLPGWTGDGDSIVRSFTFDDFRLAVSFLIRVAFEAEERNHHPEIWNVYNQVKLTLSTHDAGNKVTETDLELARAINELAAKAI